MKARLILLSIWMVGAAWAAPPLTTIQDVLYKADGTPFTGFLQIQWKSFEAMDTSQIATHSLRVPIVSGVLRVQLVPTTTATPVASYTVRYNSDGKVQFEEYWEVPPSSSALRVRDVRVPAPPGSITPAPLEVVHEADVVGLVSDLAARPVKGPGFAPSRAVFINASGAVEAVTGNLDDCVRVDGSAGPCGGGSVGAGFVDGVTPAGLINGSNLVFTLPDAPDPSASLAVYRNGLLQSLGADYTLAGNVVTFAAASAPQAGDTLLASYRMGTAGAPSGQAGGALTGTYPNPSLALEVVADANVSAVAGIRESKLALNYPTHSNANDPLPDEKAALAGTTGAPGSTNRYVTDQDARLSDSRPPSGHGLLSAAHPDTSPGTPVRGDLLTAQGTSPTLWNRLPLGPANRCLISNGADAVWNACLYTGFPEGSIPFVDGSGNLAASNTRLVWSESNRKLSVGNNMAAATLNVYDAEPSTGSTTLAVRAGQGQGSGPLQQWLDATGAEVSRVESDGRFAAASFQGASSGSRAAWRDTGMAGDPASSADGDVWYNTAAGARKTVEAGQGHTLPQVLCSSTGTATGATTPTSLGRCTVPANLLKPGDRVEIRFDYSHAGAASGFSFEVRWGATALAGRTAEAAEAKIAGRAEAGIHSSGAQWNQTNWGAVTAFSAGVGDATDALSAPLAIDFRASLASAGADTVTLQNFTVLRYPAQQNP